jgi:long-chain fatty acid transport protein
MVRKGHKMHYLFFLSLLFFFTPPNSYASNPSQGAKAAAMGTAVVAIADDPSAIAHNPAGLVNLRGTHLYNGMTALTIKSMFENPRGQSEKTQFQVFMPFHLYLCSDLGIEKMAFGLGIFSPFGIGGRRWPDTGLTRYVSTDSFIGTININPAFAWSPFSGFSLGLGIDYIYANSKSKRKMDQSFLGGPDGRFKFEGNGGGWGFNLGLLYKVSEKVSVGATYRSRVNVPLDGEITLKDIASPLQPLFGGSRFKTDAETTIHFPANITAGVAYHPTKRWTLGFDVEWMDWSRFAKSRLDIEREVPAAGFTGGSMDLGWGTQWLIKFGVEHALSEKTFLRGGYVYGKSPVPERTLSPDNPDSDQHNLAFGFGYKGKKYVFDLYYNATFYPERKVTNPILSGKYESLIHAVGFSLGYRF